MCEYSAQFVEGRHSPGVITIVRPSALLDTLRAAMKRSSGEVISDHAFVSYVSEDLDRVTALAAALRDYQITVWLDRRELAPGADWRSDIRAAIRGGLSFIACFSAASESRGRSFMREEIEVAIEEMRLRSPRQTWFIPVKLDDCEIPDLPLSPGATLRDIHYLEMRDGLDEVAARLATAIRPSMLVSEELRVRAAQTDDLGESLSRLSRAIRADPNNRRALYDSGLAKIEAGDFLSASDDFERAATLSSESLLPRRELGRALWLAGMTDEALAAFSRCVRGSDDPVDSLPALYDFASLLYSVGRLDESAAAFRRGSELAPDDVSFARASLRPLLHLRNGSRILDQVLRVSRRHQHPDVDEARAFGLIVEHELTSLSSVMPPIDMSGLPDITRKAWQDAVGPDDPAKRAIRPTHVRQVAEALDRAMAADPDNPHRLYRAAAMFAHIYEPDRAGPVVEQALALAPGSQALHLLMAYACEYAWDKRRADECVGHFAKVHDLWSDPILLEDPLPRLTDDHRSPYPDVTRYTLVRPKVGGVAAAGFGGTF